MGVIDYAGKGTIKALWERMRGYAQDRHDELSKELDDRIEAAEKASEKLSSDLALKVQSNADSIASVEERVKETETSVSSIIQYADTGVYYEKEREA